jgi:hypothetical protein
MSCRILNIDMALATYFGAAIGAIFLLSVVRPFAEEKVRTPGADRHSTNLPVHDANLAVVHLNPIDDDLR